ncbi:MAG: oligogalacturonide lyase [Candidatus Latescibacteria bacterium]|jgi:oligogalacturonide lyase|nr:oligogalacturonide lyase [Candidatus Latescibacterota bacterium]MBT4140880.1 oligogalacturonide lyase [Candidatus Latescibacterota bacterium]
MGKGRVHHDPKFSYTDSYSGREVHRLTDYLGHSNHFYFTDPCWFNDGRSFVFTSQRENSGNLFRYDLDDGKITQMTDMNTHGRPGGCLSVANQAVYFGQGRKIIELKLDSLEERVVLEYEGEMDMRGRANPTADGKYLCTNLMENIPEEGKSVSFAYSRFVEFFEKRPLSQIARIEVATGKLEVVHEDRRYLGHINTSPTQADILTFCHEGPWNRVDQRMWGLNIQTGEAWKIRDQEGQNIAVGHEYWFADGEHIGYHGRPRDGKGNHVFGLLKYDNSNHREVNFPFHSTHFHSLDENMMVGDGNRWGGTNAKPFIQLFKWDGEQYVGPKILSYHRSTFNDQHAHCHPRFTPDGKSILYSSDLTSYANMYLVDIGDFDSLPDLTEDTDGGR